MTLHGLRYLDSQALDFSHSRKEALVVSQLISADLRRMVTNKDWIKGK